MTSRSKATTTPAAAKAAAFGGDLARMRQAPTHPGEVFRIEFREAQDPPVTQAAASRALGWSTNRLNELEKGKRGITPDNAIALALLTGTSPEFWMNLQQRYDLWHALHRAKNVKRVLAGAPFPRVQHEE